MLVEKKLMAKKQAKSTKPKRKPRADYHSSWPKKVLAMSKSKTPVNYSHIAKKLNCSISYVVSCRRRHTEFKEAIKETQSITCGGHAGRTIKYRPDWPDRVRRMYKPGVAATNEQIGQVLGCSIAYVCDCKNMYQEFKEATKEIQERAADLMENALYQRGLGSVLPDTKAQWVPDREVVLKDADGNERVEVIPGRWEYADLRKHYPPDYQSASLYLRNVRPEKWRDRVEVDQRVLMRKEFDAQMAEYTDEEIIHAAQRLYLFNLGGQPLLEEYYGKGATHELPAPKGKNADDK